MERNTLGDTIRQLRKRANMTQEELADGICSAVSISRIENGTQMPSSNTLDSILEKLGSSTYQLCDIYYKTDVQLAFEDKFKQIELLIQRGDFEEAKEKLAEIDIITFDNAKIAQMYLMIEGIIELQYHRNPEMAAEKLLKGLYKTKKEIDLENFRNILLTEQETNILNVLLATYFELGKFSKAISLITFIILQCLFGFAERFYFYRVMKLSGMQMFGLLNDYKLNHIVTVKAARSKVFLFWRL